jgi:ABC-2 type transport system ATP-binding protein
MALEVSSVVKRFGDNTAVDHISFQIDRPSVFGLLGTNGAGKTTTIRLILGILKKDEGLIQWNGRPVTRETVSFGYLAEERGLYPKARIVDQLSYFGRLRGMDGKSVKKAIGYWFDRLKVSEYANSTAEQLSKGNQQKIQFITALLHDPELVVLDEPLSGLDPVNADLFKGVIYELVDKGKFIIMSSHQMHSIEDYCEDIIILKAGATVLKGNLKQIKAGYGRTNLNVSGGEGIDRLIDNLGMKLIARTAGGYELAIKSDAEAYRLLDKIMASRIRLDKFEIREPSLHEIFIDKVGEQ